MSPLTMQFLGAILVAVITGGLTFLGQRMLSKSSQQAGAVQAEVEQRKVDQATFDRLVAKYEKDMERIEKQNTKLVHQLDQMGGFLSVSVQYIVSLKRAVSEAAPDIQLPRTPSEITKLPLWYYHTNEGE